MHRFGSRKEGADHAVLTDPSSIAWSFNIRGSDVPHTPLALGFAILSAEGRPLLFMDGRKLPISAEAYLTQLADLHAPDRLEAEIAALARSGASIMLDPALHHRVLAAAMQGGPLGVAELSATASSIPSTAA